MHTGIFISVPVASHISHKVIFQPCVNSVAWHGKGFHGCIQNTPMLQLCVFGVCVYVGGVACISVAGCVFVSSTVGGKGGGGYVIDNSTWAMAYLHVSFFNSQL